MWQKIKILFKMPDTKLYQVLDVPENNPKRSQAVNLAALYPKLIRKVIKLKREANRLKEDVQRNQNNEKRLKNQIESLLEEKNNFQIKTKQLEVMLANKSKTVSPVGGLQTDSSLKEKEGVDVSSIDSTKFIEEEGVYMPIEERIIDEKGQLGELYKV